MKTIRFHTAVLFLLFCTHAFAAETVLQEWAFDKDIESWQPNDQLRNVTFADGAISFDVGDYDPILVSPELAIPATPWQGICFRMRATRGGTCSLFWTETLEGQYGGFSEEKKELFVLRGTGDWEDICVQPFWGKIAQLKRLRLDVYENAHFEIDYIRVVSWGDAPSETTATSTWDLRDAATGWRSLSGSSKIISPPLRMALGENTWAAITLASNKPGVASLLWASSAWNGAHSRWIEIVPDGREHVYNVQLEGEDLKQSPIALLGLDLPEGVTPISVALGTEPTGPVDLRVTYAGAENAAARPNKPFNVLACFSNYGGTATTAQTVTLGLPEGLRLVGGESTQSLRALAFEERAELRWSVVSERPGDYAISISGDGAEHVNAKGVVRVLSEVNVPAATYVPVPRPIETSIDIAAYYFPGWEAPVKWDCIRNTAPVRKPMLGYYDESNPECVDWQIKWAVENGVKVFLVDWYWSRGEQFLTHWMEAYKKSKYRDQLKIAIMWANHNSPGSHSPEDWASATKTWIEDYFRLDSYYRIDGKPAFFLWDPRNLRNDLGGGDGAKAALEHSQQLARDAGFDGIHFVALNTVYSEASIKQVAADGYAGVTEYHEWGGLSSQVYPGRRVEYGDIAKDIVETWNEKHTVTQPLKHYPVVDTGWDPRPWHGEQSFIVQNRTVAHFKTLLSLAKDHVESSKPGLLILGPWNEWGEGSYIEPCNEFNFEMLEAIRDVFGTGDRAQWPVNIGPGDVGLGPYDYAPPKPVTSWNFDDGLGGWRGFMNVSRVRAENGAMLFVTTSTDPALVAGPSGLDANVRKTFRIRMSAKTSDAQTQSLLAQIFWSRAGKATSEENSVNFTINADGQMHDYAIAMDANQGWRGDINLIRLDPCSVHSVEFAIDSVSVE